MAQPTTKQQDDLVCEPTIDPKTKKHLLVCSLDVGTRSTKHIHEPVRMILKGSYFKERPRLHKMLDAIGVLAGAALIAILVFLLLPRYTPDYVVVDATVAPTEVVTGAASTLTFRYENTSRETLRNARLSFSFPAYFALEGYESDSADLVSSRTFALGDIAPTEYGFIHVKGVMFGAVGGEQVFTTNMDYTYGEEEQDTIVTEHTFSPTRSTLVLELELPEHLVEHQEVDGVIRYTNTGDITFPDLIIEPTWPESFILHESSPEQQDDGTFTVLGIEPGEIGEITFSGRLGTLDDSQFSFHPAFSFGTDIYHQDLLTNIVDILPPPLQVSHSVTESVLEPGETMNIQVNWENAGEADVTDTQIRLRIEPSGILGTSGIAGATYVDGYYIVDLDDTAIAIGESGSTTVSIPVRSSISKSQTSVYENIQVSTQSSATFAFDVDGQTANVNSVGSEITTPLTSPVVLESFAQFWTSTGDQIGRGFIPPVAFESTKYWVFWNIAGTTNQLENIRIEADLGPNVVLTGRQSVSVGSSVSSSNGSVVWTVNSVAPTLPDGSTVVGAAFEVMITPTEAQIGSTPTLLERATITARDTVTQSFVSSSASPVTTALPNDAKASQYGGIVEP